MSTFVFKAYVLSLPFLSVRFPRWRFSWRDVRTGCPTNDSDRYSPSQDTDLPSVFVNGRPRPAIIENMRTRIDRGDIKAERLEAIQAMCDIAVDRASKLQAN
jgi:hypothetical protein